MQYFCVNALHNLDKVDAFMAVKEMHRVLKNKNKIFIQVDAYRNKSDLEVFEKWVLTAKMYLQPDEWLKFFRDCGYSGAYYWTILKSDGSVEDISRFSGYSPTITEYATNPNSNIEAKYTAFMMTKDMKLYGYNWNSGILTFE